MAGIRFTTGGQILFNAGQIVFNDTCCCDEGWDPDCCSDGTPPELGLRIITPDEDTCADIASETLGQVVASPYSVSGSATCQEYDGDPDHDTLYTYRFTFDPPFEVVDDPNNHQLEYIDVTTRVRTMSSVGKIQAISIGVYGSGDETGGTVQVAVSYADETNLPAEGTLPTTCQDLNVDMLLSELVADFCLAVSGTFIQVLPLYPA